MFNINMLTAQVNDGGGGSAAATASLINEVSSYLLSRSSKSQLPPEARVTMEDTAKCTTSSEALPSEIMSNGNGTKVELLSDAKCFNGRQKIYKHYSQETKCFMKFSIYIPDAELPDEKFDAVFFLSGIMCNEQNFLFKTAFQRYASEQKLIVVGCDTSPRGCDLPGDRVSPIFGRSAGWYVDATEEPWSRNYRMYSYISAELPAIIRKEFPTTGKFGLMGHSMGGNGTLVIGLRNPDTFECLSVLAPSCNPTSWGHELIFKKFLGDNKELWETYDASCVIKNYNGPPRHILLDQGADDEYLNFLLPTTLEDCAKENPNGQVYVDVNMHEGYDHSYFFAASFIERHLKFQKTCLTLSKVAE